MRLTGAGVLVYTVHQDEVLILLGRERETPGWKQGSHKWSSFSGKVESHEDALHGAAREFTEETCACVPLGEQITPTTVREVVAQLQQHAIPVEQSIMGRGERLVYYTYVTRVTYRPHAAVFAQTRATLLEFDNVFRNFHRLKKIADSAPRFFFPGFVLTPCIVVANVRVLGPTEVEVTMHEKDSAADLIFVFCVTQHVATLMQELEASWQQVKAFISARVHDPIFAHPAVNLVTSKGQIVSAYIDKAYLEKCEVEWWRLSELQDASENPRRAWPFRKLFIENLRELTRHIIQFEEQKSGIAPAPTEA